MLEKYLIQILLRFQTQESQTDLFFTRGLPREKVLS